MVAPKFVRRVRINRQQAQGFFWPDRDLPGLRPRQKEALRRSEFVDHGRLCALEREQVRLVRDAEPPEVADVLADRERPVDVVAGRLSRLERVVLCDQRGGALLERRAVGLCPPVVQSAVAIEA